MLMEVDRVEVDSSNSIEMIVHCVMCTTRYSQSYIHKQKTCTHILSLSLLSTYMLSSTMSCSLVVRDTLPSLTSCMLDMATSFDLSPVESTGTSINRVTDTSGDKDEDVGVTL